MEVNLLIMLIYAYVMVLMILQPIYHHTKAKKVVFIFLGLFLITSIIRYIYGFFHGDIMVFAPVVSTSLSFFAQLRYSNQIKRTQGFYPRVFYKRLPIKGLIVKHPDLNSPRSEFDNVMTMQAFLSLIIGALLVFVLSLASRT